MTPPQSTLNTTFFVGFSKYFPKIGGSAPGFLPKQVTLGLHEQVPSVPGTSSVRVVTHHGDGNVCRLAHNKFGGRCQLVGYRQNARGEEMAVEIQRATIVGQRVHTGDPYGNVGDTLPQRPPERVGDDDRKVCSYLRNQGVAQLSCGGVRVYGEETDRIAAGDVRGVDTGVRADEAVVCLRDDDAALHPHDATALAEDDLDVAWVLVVPIGEAFGKGRRLDGVEVHETPLGLAHNLMRHCHDVTCPEQTVPCSPDNMVRQIIARAHLGDPIHG